MYKTDEELVTLAARGDTDAFNQLVVRWEQSIQALVYRILGREEDARDVCQEAFLRAFRGLKGFKGQAKFSSWLYRIAVNLCRDWLRRERRRGVIQPSEGFELDEQGVVDPINETVEDLDYSPRSRSRGLEGHGDFARGAADGDCAQGVSRLDVSGDR